MIFKEYLAYLYGYVKNLPHNLSALKHSSRVGTHSQDGVPQNPWLIQTIRELKLKSYGEFKTDYLWTQAARERIALRKKQASEAPSLHFQVTRKVSQAVSMRFMPLETRWLAEEDPTHSHSYLNLAKQVDKITKGND